MRELKPPIEAELSALQRESFRHFTQEANPAGGLVGDQSAQKVAY
jgi:hypothetical protein